MSERFGYAKPPITEALCHLAFAERAAWNAAVPGLLFNEVRGRYQRVPEGQIQLAAEAVQLSPNGGVAPSSLQLDTDNARFLFKDETETQLLTASHAGLSANRLAPYLSWPQLREQVEYAVQAMTGVLEVSRVKQVSVRYINRIQVPVSVADFADYFNITFVSADEGARLDSILSRVVYNLDDEHETQCLVAFATAVPTEDEEGGGEVLLLDIEVRREFSSQPISFADAILQADALKEIENREFEHRITDRTRELFA